MKPPLHNAKRLRELGEILASIHPVARRSLGDAATQLEILDEITREWMEKDGNLDKLDAAVARLNARRLAEAVGSSAGASLVHTDGKVAGLEEPPFNVSRN